MISLQSLHELPLKEKLFIMEALWDDLSAQVTAVDVPQWQQELLDEREAAIASGTAQFMDWEDAKKEIMEALR